MEHSSSHPYHASVFTLPEKCVNSYSYGLLNCLHRLLVGRKALITLVSLFVVQACAMIIICVGLSGPKGK